MQPRSARALLSCGAIVHFMLCFGHPGVSAGIQTEESLTAAESTNPVRSIELPHLEPDLVVSPGRDEFMMVCVGCHSPRYVQMQPPFAQRQWELTVDKMANSYGAQMDADQRTAIIGYLVATRGPNSAAQPASARDDELDALSAPQGPPPPEMAPVLSLPADPAPLAAEVKRAENLFVQNCAGCHGVDGRGDGFVAPVLFRKPKNLAATRFSLTLLSQVLWNGKRGTAMPSWRGLSQLDRAALAAYVQALHPPAKPERRSPQSVEQGAKVFMQNCAPCHGEAGDGNGANAANLFPRPANFKLKQPDSDYLLQVLNHGIPGTAMPTWKDQITELDRRALADFVRSLFKSGRSSER
jgi:mono/diheme cytochrome c family protein